MSDNLFVVLGMIRAEMQKIETDEEWEMAKRLLSKHVGGTRPYCPIEKKREHLANLEALDGQPPQQAAKKLGISVRRVQQLRRLR